MMNRIGVIGFGVSCFLVGAMFVTLMGTSKAPEVSSGRYQVSAIGAGCGVFVLDTQTGHLWFRARYAQGDWESENLGKIPQYGVLPFEELRRRAESQQESQGQK